MVVAKYPATRGHTTVINQLCKGLKELDHKTAIGAFSFTEDPPYNIEKIVLNKSKLLSQGVNYLDYNVIHSHQARVHYYLLTKNPTKPLVFHYHGAANKIQELNFKFSMKLYKNKISKIISVSNTGILQMKRIVGNVDATVVYNGADTNFFNSSLPTPHKKGDPQLLFVSALHKYKNAGILISAMPKILKKFPKANLQIVGTGEDVPHLEELIKKLNLHDKVELVGKVDNDELRLRYSSCDIYISASSFEVCPVPTLEAMSSGKPLVLYNIEPHKEMIGLSKAGVLFDKLDSNEICEKIEKIYLNKKELSETARNFALKYDWKIICKQMSKIYEELP